MGRDKRFIRIHIGETQEREEQSTTFLERALSIAAGVPGVAPERILVCGRVPGIASFPDATPGIGPLAGIMTAVIEACKVSRLDHPLLVVIPVDMPLLTSGMLDQLATALALDTSCNSVQFSDQELPFALRCDEKAETLLKTLCSPGANHVRSIRSILEGLQTKKLPSLADLSPQMKNLNRPSDLSNLDGVQIGEFST
jgi:molybdopterin-guanine dinucleotide biosynthesis protein A